VKESKKSGTREPKVLPQKGIEAYSRTAAVLEGGQSRTGAKIYKER